MRAAVDLALLEVMRDGLLRGSEASALRWVELGFHPDGSGRLHVARSKTDQTAEGTVLYLGPAAVDDLLAIQPHEAVIAPGASVFGLTAGQISRRIKAATKMAGLGEGFSAHSPRVGMAQDLSAVGAELPELMTAGRGGTARRCRPGTPRPRLPAGARSPGITGATSGSDRSPGKRLRSNGDSSTAAFDVGRIRVSGRRFYWSAAPKASCSTFQPKATWFFALPCSLMAHSPHDCPLEVSGY